MMLKINNDQKIATIKDEFNAMFPYLKLEFFKYKHTAHKGSFKSDMLNPELTLNSIRRKHNEGVLHINENMSVTELEQLFQRLFGISAQVFRKSGKSWIETSITDNWTLGHQNAEGRELSELRK
jgi:hypothetical protein